MPEHNSFSVSGRVLSLVDDPEGALKTILEVQNLQKDLEITTDKLRSFFAEGVTLYEEGRCQEAADAFHFLTASRPEIPNFWIGLGRALQGQEEYIEALRAYKMGIVAGSKELENYLHAVRLCVELHDYSHALEILQVGLEQTQDCPSTPQLEEARSEARALYYYCEVQYDLNV